MEDLKAMENHFDRVRVDHCVVMPNHIHAIVVIGCDGENIKNPSLEVVVGQYKSGVSRKIREIQPGFQIWQRSFHDHVIRNQADYMRIWNYIENNPVKWNEDCFYQND